MTLIFIIWPSCVCNSSDSLIHESEYSARKGGDKRLNHGDISP